MGGKNVEEGYDEKDMMKMKRKRIAKLEKMKTPT